MGGNVKVSVLRYILAVGVMTIISQVIGLALLPSVTVLVSSNLGIAGDMSLMAICFSAASLLPLSFLFAWYPLYRDDAFTWIEYARDVVAYAVILVIAMFVPAGRIFAALIIGAMMTDNTKPKENESEGKLCEEGGCI